MFIDPTVWPRLHGASTHFPMALAMAAVLFEGLGFVWPKSSPHKAQLHAAGYFTIILGALGTFPAVLSGLFMTKGEVLGHDALLFHHLFVWPAFAGLVGLGVPVGGMDPPLAGAGATLRVKSWVTVPVPSVARMVMG